MVILFFDHKFHTLSLTLTKLAVGFGSRSNPTFTYIKDSPQVTEKAVTKLVPPFHTDSAIKMIYEFMKDILLLFFYVVKTKLLSISTILFLHQNLF